MGRAWWFIAGVLSLAIVLAIAASISLRPAHGFSALDAPTAMERWVAGRARDLSMPSAAKQAINPIPDSPRVLAEAEAHWADHCASCHANNGSGDTEMGKHSYPRAPDLRLSETQNKTDGELFFIIENGVRMSAMPGWAVPGHEDDSWKLVRFIRHLPHLTPQEELDMQKMNPKSPDELEEEQEENNFLNGAEINESKPHAH